MALPKSCCCFFDLNIGCFILAAFVCIGHASTLVDTIINFEASEDEKFEGGEVWYGTVAAWCIIGILTVICLVIGVALKNMELIKTYLVVALISLIPMAVRTGYVLSTDPLYAIKLLFINGLNIYLYIIAYSIYRNLQTAHDKFQEYHSYFREERIGLLVTPQ